MGRTLFRALSNQTPISYAPSRRGGGLFTANPGAGAEAQLRAMGSASTLFSIVSVVSTAVAQVDWKLYRKAASGLDEDRTEVTSHAALDLWRKPNPFMPRNEFVEVFSQHLELVGEGWWVVGRDPRSTIPLELWPARPDRMEPVPDPERFLSGYTYTGPGGEEVPLGLDEVVFLRRPNPMDPYRGMAPVQSVLPDLDATRYSAEWNRNFFLNSAQPGGIIEVPNHLSDTEFDELRTRWNEQHRGTSNAHRVAILEQGTWKDRTITQQDMQFVELRGVSRDVIREAYGIPRSALGDLEDVNRASALAAKAWFAEQLTVPRLERIKAALNHDLLPLFGAAARGLEFDYCDPIPPDPETQNAALTAKAQAAQALRNAGWHGEDVLSAVGLPAMEGVDPREEVIIRIVTGAPSTAPLLLPLLGYDLPTAETGEATPRELAEMVQKLYLGVDSVLTWEEARQILAAAGAPINPTAPRPVPAPAAGPQARALTVFDRARDRLLRNATGDDALEQMREDHAAALEQLLEDFEPIGDGWIDALGEQIEAAVDDEDTEALAALSVDSDEAATVVRAAIGAAAQQAADRMAEEAAEQGVDVDAPRVDESVTNRLRAGEIVAFGDELAAVAAAVAALLAGGMAATAAQEAVRRFVPGVSGSEIANAVKGFLRGLKNVFRRDQLGGAIHRAQNVGRIAVLETAPVARWVATEKNDTNTCPPCREIDGTVFESLTDVIAAYGAGPYHACEGGIRCRGTVTAYWDTTGDS